MLVSAICIYLLLNVVVGLWASRRINTTEDFVLAGRRLPMAMATMVTFATWFGSETMMGAPSHFLEGGFLSVIEEPFGAALCLVLVGVFFARTFYRWNIITFCDFFLIRFGRASEFVSAIMIIPSYFGWIAAQFVAMGIVGQVIFGLPLTTGIWVGAALVAVYTLTGGMWSISITDFLHNIILIIGLVVLAVILFTKTGGITAVTSQQPADFFRFVPKEVTFQSYAEYLAAWITIGLGSIPQQDVFQRVMSSKDANTAVRSSILAGFLYLTVALLPLFIALASKSLYPELMQGDTKMIIPNMVLQHAPLWIQILFFGALISALLSTSSGAILAPAAVLGENLIKPYFPKLTDSQLLTVIRGGVLLVTLVSIWMAQSRQDIFELVAESSSISLVSLFVPLTFGLYWKRATSAGCLASMILGLGAWFMCEYVWETTFPSLIYGISASLAGMTAGSYAYPKKG
ncbi:sodium:solute symporter family protein [Runella sp.]|uniref:sodium:solute symporter family protein n=1 Tax=Runella sp. TaxID=1960881 RepID=UPI003D151460